MNPRQLYAPAAVLVMSVVFGLVAKSATLADYTKELFFAVGIVSAGIVLVSASGKGGVSLAGLLDAMRAAARGKRTKPPEGASTELAEAYEELERLAKKHAEMVQEIEELESRAKEGG